MSLNILFVDGTCPKPYDPNSLATEGMGGTEATVIRVAEGLGQRGSSFNSCVEQHNRTANRSFWAHYYTPELCDDTDVVVSLRYPALIPLMQARFPNARHLLWLHDLAIPEYCKLMLECNNFEAICVSNFHRSQVLDMLRQQGYRNNFPIHVLYNPIDDGLIPDNTPYDKNKLLWTASPHKGLDYGLGIFGELLKLNPDFRLYVANPGYLSGTPETHPNIIALGPVPHAKVIAHLRSSLCLFYPNTVFPETFGLVLAESEAVGTPVLCNHMGAASEVTYHPNEVLDCRNVQAVIERVMDWHSGERPKVRCQQKFRLSNVIRAWERLLVKE